MKWAAHVHIVDCLSWMVTNLISEHETVPVPRLSTGGKLRGRARAHISLSGKQLENAGEGAAFPKFHVRTRMRMGFASMRFRYCACTRRRPRLWPLCWQSSQNGSDSAVFMRSDAPSCTAHAYVGQQIVSGQSCKWLQGQHSTAKRECNRMSQLRNRKPESINIIITSFA